MFSLASSTWVVSMSVINEDLIRACIYIPPSTLDLEEKKNRELVQMQQQMRELPLLHEVECLMFSFKAIYRIDNLSGFDALSKLQLDNNDITKIENLHHLKNLRWLDLSFNKICKLEGLEGLDQIEDLSLHHNEIEVIEGLDDLIHLNCLSLGDNKINRLENIMYLRKFRKLQLVALSGNPICTPEVEYRNYVLSHLKHLKYMDYRLVDAAHVVSAREIYQDELLVLEEEEDRIDRELAAAEERKKLEERMASANLSGIDVLFERLFTEDPEVERMSLFKHIIQVPRSEFQQAILPLVENFKDAMFTLQDKKKEREASLHEMEDTKAAYEASTVSIIGKLEKRKKHVLESCSSNESPDIVDEMLDELKREFDASYERLMEMELEQVEIYQGHLTDYEKKLKDVSNTAVETIQNFFMKFTAEEDQFHEKLADLFANEHEKRISEESDVVQSGMALDEERRAAPLTSEYSDEDDMPSEAAPTASMEAPIADGGERLNDSAKQIVEDKDVYMNMLQDSHDGRVKLLDSKETELTENEHKALKAMIDVVNTKEYQRNRLRVSEISTFIKRLRSEVEEFEKGSEFL